MSCHSFLLHIILPLPPPFPSLLPLSFFSFPSPSSPSSPLTTPSSSPSPPLYTPHPLLSLPLSHTLSSALLCALNIWCIFAIIRFSISFFVSTDAALSVRGLDIYCTLSAYHLSSCILSYLLLSSASFFSSFTAILTSFLSFLSFLSLLSSFLCSYSSIHFCSSLLPSSSPSFPPSYSPPPLSYLLPFISTPIPIPTPTPIFYLMPNN